MPSTMSVAPTAAPKGKLPSTVRSGKFRTRNERKTLNETRPKSSPISIAPRNATIFMRTPARSTAAPHGTARNPSSVRKKLIVRSEDLLRLGDQIRRYCDPHLLGRAAIDVELGDLGALDGDVARLLALEDADDDLAR